MRLLLILHLQQLLRSIALLQLTPVLVDVDLYNMNISIDRIKAAITPKTKAIVPVHLFGRAANMEAVMTLAKEHNLYVIEDNAQAIGAIVNSLMVLSIRQVQLVMLATSLSFKKLRLLRRWVGHTNDDALAHKLRGIVNHMYV
jgi:dTDP-4-amino-4,6-dideoxygalactose transaminase